MLRGPPIQIVGVILILCPIYKINSTYHVIPVYFVVHGFDFTNVEENRCTWSNSNFINVKLELIISHRSNKKLMCSYAYHVLCACICVHIVWMCPVCVCVTVCVWVGERDDNNNINIFHYVHRTWLLLLLLWNNNFTVGSTLNGATISC